MNKNFTHFRTAVLAATVAACAIAVPAQARDGEGYVGIDVGLVIPKDTKIDVNSFDNNAVVVDNKHGWGIDGVIGYDWGMLRTEAELGHTQWKPNALAVTVPGVYSPSVVGTFSDPGGKTTITTAMANALLDFGGNGGVGFSVGVGAGRAWANNRLATTSGGTRFLDDSDSAWAWQGLAELRVPVSESIELGLKYKYLNTHRFHEVDSLGRANDFGVAAHSIMASVLFNFGGHAAPPPPPPPPQTKTCPDGSTVGLYDNCPVPPPPVVAPQGERG